jgi:hypothetical protein
MPSRLLDAPLGIRPLDHVVAARFLPVWSGWHSGDIAATDCDRGVETGKRVAVLFPYGRMRRHARPARERWSNVAARSNSVLSGGFQTVITEGVGEEFEAGYRAAETPPALWPEACRSPMLREMIWSSVRRDGNRRAG